MIHGEVLERRVRLAVAAAEYLLERRLRSVLDVGVDSSAYAVRRFGQRRNIRLGTFGELGRMDLSGPFDLVVCSDVLHYVSTAELRRGVRALARWTGGVAFLEVFTGEDEVEGDEHEFQRRGEAVYRRLLRDAGLTPLGLHLWAGSGLARQLLRFERSPGASKRAP